MQNPLAQAIQHLKAGRPEEAIAPLTHAASLNPNNPTIQHDLGLACLETGRLDQAAHAFQRAIAANPRYTDAYFRLGVTQERLGQPQAAIVAYDKATELLPGHTEAWFRAGALVYLLGHVNEAVGCFRRAAATGPKTSFGRLGAARALLAEDRDAEAERTLRQLLALDKEHPMALDLLGNVLADKGNFEEARACFARAIAAAPLLAGAYYDLVRCRRLTEEEADLIPQMEAALNTPGLATQHRTRIHLALGKAADDLNNPERAMHHYNAADTLRAETVPFDAAAFDTEITRLIATFTAERLATAAATGNPSATPILILGMPRSGTTLVEQIISSHPEVAGAGELGFWGDRATAWHRAGPAGLQAPFLTEAANDYLALLEKRAPKSPHVTDKMPFNFLWAGLIHLALPNATFIHCRRAAIDTALSIHQTQFNPLLPFPTGGPALVAYFASYTRLMAHWRQVLPPARFIEVDYETLTAEPAQEIPRLIAACRLPWNESCLHPERNNRIVKTPSKWQARQPIYRTATNRWRRYEPWLGALRPLLPA
jgi:Flp pilus assembly protein TadD